MARPRFQLVHNPALPIWRGFGFGYRIPIPDRLGLSLMTERDADAQATQMLAKISTLSANAAPITLDLSHQEAVQMAGLLRDALRFRAGWRAIREAASHGAGLTR